MDVAFLVSSTSHGKHGVTSSARQLGVGFTVLVMTTVTHEIFTVSGVWDEESGDLRTEQKQE